MSGLEALHWANRYPDEVAAIIGLDPAVPPIYEVMPPPRLMLRLVAFTSRTGLLRLAPSICREAAAVIDLTDAETSAYCSIMVRRTFTADVLAETEVTQSNARMVAAEGFPNVPMTFYTSDGEGLTVDNWGEILVAYAEEAESPYQMLDVGHYVHHEAADLIADESRLFLQQIEP